MQNIGIEDCEVNLPERQLTEERQRLASLRLQTDKEFLTSQGYTERKTVTDDEISSKKSLLRLQLMREDMILSFPGSETGIAQQRDLVLFYALGHSTANFPYDDRRLKTNEITVISLAVEHVLTTLTTDT